MKRIEKENKWATRGRTVWLYTKYQVVTKVILALILMPCFQFIISFLIKSSGRSNLSSGDYIGFFTSIYGIPLIIVGILLLITVLGIDINTFVIISGLMEENRLRINMLDVLKQAIKSVKYFFSPIGAFITIFVGVIFPILGVGISISPLKDLKIPNFITSVIFNHPLYRLLYYGLLIVLFIVSFLYIFTIHFVILEKMSVMDGLRSSRKLVKKNLKLFISDYFLSIIKVFFIMAIIFLIVLLSNLLLIFGLKFIYSNENVLSILVILLSCELLSFFAFLSVPIAISILTKLFYKYREAEGKRPVFHPVGKTNYLKEEDLGREIKARTKVELIVFLLIVVAVNFIVSVTFEKSFDTFFGTKVDIAVVAHRGGGDLATENTIEGIDAAARKGAKWTEIDVQRTKDGAYVINHDLTFSRLAGVDRKVTEMTLAEIKTLTLKNEFNRGTPTGTVPTFEEILDACKGKIGVFVELKGKSADEKMVDDLISIIKKKEMLKECVILSLDYKIIEYTEENYPEIDTGFLYFFSVGALKNLKGDYLIMEEVVATDKKIKETHQAGKKVIVWTVNTEKSIKLFIDKDIDGIITDHVLLVNEHISEANKRTQLEVIADHLLKRNQR